MGAAGEAGQSLGEVEDGDTGRFPMVLREEVLKKFPKPSDNKMNLRNHTES